MSAGVAEWGKNPRPTLRFNDETRAVLDRVAERTGMSRTDEIRRRLVGAEFVERFLEDHGSKTLDELRVVVHERQNRPVAPPRAEAPAVEVPKPEAEVPAATPPVKEEKKDLPLWAKWTLFGIAIAALLVGTLRLFV